MEFYILRICPTKEREYIHMIEKRKVRVSGLISQKLGLLPLHLLIVLNQESSRVIQNIGSMSPVGEHQPLQIVLQLKMEAIKTGSG
ncbi:hypothetical protein C5167_036178 [Papaver somniferum]|nr:hypothetical protein C5167_036178 [Papaver somniferum]